MADSIAEAANRFAPQAIASAAPSVIIERNDNGSAHSARPPSCAAQMPMTTIAIR